MSNDFQEERLKLMRQVLDLYDPKTLEKLLIQKTQE